MAGKPKTGCGRRTCSYLQRGYPRIGVLHVTLTLTLTLTLSANRCAEVVKIVIAGQPGVRELTDKDLPKTTFANRCRYELGALCNIDACVKIAKNANKACVLGTDEGTHNQESSNAVVAHYEGMSGQCLGIDKLATHFAREGADKTQNRMHKYGELSERVTEKLGPGLIELSGAERKLTYSVAAFSATITDQCNSQKAMNKLLDEMKAVELQEWQGASSTEEKAKRSPLLDGDMQHVYCYIHAGVNLAAKFDEVFKLYGSSSGPLRANVDDDAADDNDAVSEAAPDDFEIESIVASRLRSMPGGDDVKEYRIRWKGWGAEHDTWEPASHMLHAEDAILEHDQTRQEVIVGKKVKVYRRTCSKLHQLVYEIGKFLCVQAGKGTKEDQKGVAFTKCVPICLSVVVRSSSSSPTASNSSSKQQAASSSNKQQATASNKASYKQQQQQQQQSSLSAASSPATASSSSKQQQAATAASSKQQATSSKQQQAAATTAFVVVVVVVVVVVLACSCSCCRCGI